MFLRPFLGSHAVAAGLVTPNQLRGPRFRRLFHGIYVGADVRVDLALRSRAAALLHPRAVVAGWSAAELLGASCGPADAPAEIILPGGGGMRSRPGLVVRFDVLSSDEIVRRGGVAVTSALRTAFDLARSRERDDAVIALDALARVGHFPPRRVVRLGYRYIGARGAWRLPALVALADRLSGSPMETRIRLALHDAGLPTPRLQVPVGRYFLDLGYDDALLGIEHDGGHHREAAQARHDLRRQAFLTQQGWHVLRFDARTVLRNPEKLAAKVAAAREARR